MAADDDDVVARRRRWDRRNGEEVVPAIVTDVTPVSGPLFGATTVTVGHDAVKVKAWSVCRLAVRVRGRPRSPRPAACAESGPQVGG